MKSTLDVLNLICILNFHIKRDCDHNLSDRIVQNQKCAASISIKCIKAHLNPNMLSTNMLLSSQHIYSLPTILIYYCKHF